MFLQRFLIFLCSVVMTAGAADAEVWRITLGGRELGTFTHEGSGGSGPQTMVTVMDNTPFGVFDGRFEARSQRARHSDGSVVQQYYAETRSSRRNRVISVLFDGTRAIEVEVQPPQDATELSDPALASPDVLDPVRAIGVLVAGRDCPEPVRAYDGRRQIVFTTIAREVVDDRIVCTLDYRVTAGPPHLRPLRLRSIEVGLIYDAEGLAQLALRGGGFELKLER